MSSSGSTSVNNTEVDGDGKLPLWKHFKVLDKGAGGNNKIKCKFCGNEFTGSYTRVRAHLLQIEGKGVKKCLKVDYAMVAEFHNEVKKAEEVARSAKPKHVPLPPSKYPSPYASNDNESDPRKRKFESGSCENVSNPILKMYKENERDILNMLIARMFYSAGLPFHLARNPYFVEAFRYACEHNLKGYKPPGYNSLRTTLLERERGHVDSMLETIRSTWEDKGVTIVSDGWSDSQRRPLINFMAVNEHGPMFLKAIDCSGEVKDKYFIANELKKVINEVGPKNVVQVITDNAPNCKAAGRIVEEEWPHIIWTPCVVHTLNLAMKNICAAKNTENNMETFVECGWISDIIGDAMHIKNYFILNHSLRLAMYNEVVPLKLLSVAETRFASSIVMLKRMRLLKHSLQLLIVSEKWNDPNGYANEDKGKAKFMKEKVMDDIWWDQVDYILDFTRPIYDMIRFCDTDKPCLHLVYDMWDTMIEKVRVAIYKHEHKKLEEHSSFFNVVHTILVERWNKNNTPLHCLAHSLNPRYYTTQWLQEDPKRLKPPYDGEVSTERTKCIRRYFENWEDRQAVNKEFLMFSSQKGPFGDPEIKLAMATHEPQDWWMLYGVSTPMLQRIALKVLGQPSSSSCSKRNWSTYSFIHSLRRNKMTPQRAENLVFIHSNLRLLARANPKYLEGESKFFDIEGDAFDDFEDVGILSMAALTIDEPEMEEALTKNGVLEEAQESGGATVVSLDD